MNHAWCSPSKSERWSYCPGSVREELNSPKELPSVFAARGTRLHEVAAMLLSERTSNHPSVESLAVDEKIWVQDYVDYVLGIPGRLLVEYSLSLNDDCWGTSDALVIDDSQKCLHVIDLKTGEGIPVSAYENSQCKCYGLMALNEFSFLHDIETINIHIVQPSLGHLDIWQISAEELKAWEPTLLAAIEQTKNPAAPLNPSLEACQFCRARFHCKARAQHAVAIGAEAYVLRNVNELTPEQIAKVLTYKKELNRWLEDAEKYALELAINGTPIPGFELGEGRSIRRYCDADAVAQRLIEHGIESEIIFERNLLPLTRLEQLLGKKVFSELLSDLIVRQPGKTVLNLLPDSRPSLRSAVAALADHSFIPLHKE